MPTNMLADTKELQELIAATDRQLGRIEKMIETYEDKCWRCGDDVIAGQITCAECLKNVIPEPLEECPF